MFSHHKAIYNRDFIQHQKISCSLYYVFLPQWSISFNVISSNASSQLLNQRLGNKYLMFIFQLTRPSREYYWYLYHEPQCIYKTAQYFNSLSSFLTCIEYNVDVFHIYTNYTTKLLLNIKTQFQMYAHTPTNIKLMWQRLKNKPWKQLCELGDDNNENDRHHNNVKYSTK